MAYQGMSVPIVLGDAGLITDVPNSSLPLNALSKANNVSFQNGRIGKSLGCSKFNSVALSSDIVALADWWPTSALQRLIAVTDDGKIFRKGEKQRKRFKCEEVRTGKIYLFSPVYEVELVN